MPDREESEAAAPEPGVTPAPEPEATPDEVWAVVEIMGHRTRVGRIRETEAFGVKLMQIEIPRDGGAFDVEHYAGSAIFSFCRVTEAVARREAGGWRGGRTIAALPPPYEEAEDDGEVDEGAELGDWA